MLRFMAATPLHHRSRKASASYSRSECFIDKHPVLWYDYQKGGDRVQEIIEKVNAVLEKYSELLESNGIKVTVSKRYFEYSSPL